MKIFFQKGITAIELLVALAILVLLLVAILPQFSKIKSNQMLKNSTSDIISALHKAQTQTLASVNSSVYGVRFQSDRVIIFTGAAYSSSASDNETISIISPASISNVTLNGTSATIGELYFNRLSGTPSKTGTITVYTAALSKTITVSATGIVSIN